MKVPMSGTEMENTIFNAWERDGEYKMQGCGVTE